MSETTILNGGIDLINNSPFKSSLSGKFQSYTADSNFVQAVEAAKGEANLSEVGAYLQSKDHAKELYHNGVGSSALKKNNQLSASLQNELSEDANSSHLKIKLLAEHALAQLEPSEKLLSLNEIQVLQNSISELTQSKELISTELQQNLKTLKTFTSNSHGSEQEMDAIVDIIDSNESLNQRFDQISDDLFIATKTLYNQYSLAFSFCYFEGLNIEIPTKSESKGTDRRTDELLSHIASVAVQRNVILPAPNPTSDDSNIEWAKSCLDTLLNQNLSTSNTREIKNNTAGDEQEITNLKTALKDLQFAHQYLTRQYEDERNLNSSVMVTHKNKKAAVEKQLAENLITLEKANQRSILVEHEKNVLERTLDDRMKEIYELQKQIALLKIDNLGYIHTNGESTSRLTSPEKLQSSPVSPITGLTVNIDGKNDNPRSKYYSNPKTPLLQQNLNNYRTSSPSSPKFNNSISVLRNEFKKLVNEIHDSYKTEIEKEKIERKRLEHLLKLYEERSSDLEL